ncbi:hypothetical protein QGN29_02990 [Temperatibacter marinus]|uniref:Capsule polysaccharide biosynthesis protein n=1 Tax=Temperatibacter marinus TaxID=1456591 RepID=A0AA52HB26_9PROT|nr:hypothetical protein [Temperatibacter marinus]WND03335.1 hypothetical protein QGN29_02990 [Temperatibacter marinus]
MIDYSTLEELAVFLKDKKVVLYNEERFDRLFLNTKTTLNDFFFVRCHFKNEGNKVDSFFTISKYEGHQKSSRTFRIGYSYCSSNSFRTMQKKAIDSNNIKNLINYSYNNLPVGLHAWEQVLRRYENAFEMPVSHEVIKTLASVICYHKALVDFVTDVIKYIFPHFYFNGHDCYEHATLKNIFIQAKVPSLTLYKYMYNPIYRGAELNYNKSTRIHHSRRFTAMKKNHHSSIWDTHAKAAYQKLELVTKDYNQLNYMRIDPKHTAHKEAKYEELTGLIQLKSLDKEGRFLGTLGQRQLSKEDQIYVLALHSFADEATVYGIDDFIHMFDYYQSIVQAISVEHPDAIIAVRFHPNAKGIKHAVHDKDCLLQRQLFQYLYQNYKNIIISSCESRMQELAKEYSISVVTRWGTIGLECIHLNIPIICSALALYADYLDSHYVIECRDDLKKVISAQKSFMNDRSLINYDKQHIYSLAAALFYHEDGRLRSPAFFYSPEGTEYLNLSPEDIEGQAVQDLRHYLYKNCENHEDRAMVADILGWSCPEEKMQ